MGGFRHGGSVYWGGPRGAGDDVLVWFFFVLIVLGVIYLLAVIFSHHREDRRRVVSHATSAGASAPVEGDISEALRILSERFARGDIDAEEFTTRRDVLRGT